MTAYNIPNMGIMGTSSYPAPVDSVKKSNSAELQQGNIQNLKSHGKNHETANSQGVENTGEKPDFAAINLLKNSLPEPMPERRVQRYTIEDFINGESRHVNAEREARQAEQDEYATFNTAEEIAERDSGGGFTPAQERGYEAYTTAQNYSDPINMSNAGAQFVA